MLLPASVGDDVVTCHRRNTPAGLPPYAALTERRERSYAMTKGNTGWVPIIGNFDVADSNIIFHGRRRPVTPSGDPPGTEPREQASVGLLVSSNVLADGDMSAEIVFDNVTEESICELAVFYDPNATHLVCAGLGGDSDAMFSVREYGGPRTEGKGWWHHQGRGERSALKPGTPYFVEASFRGTVVALKIDHVKVAVAEVGSPPYPERQAGIFCRGDHKITVTNFRVASFKPKAFAVMQFGSHYDNVYTDVIKEVCGAYEVNVVRADEVAGPGLIVADIVREISKSQLIIADITPSNPNVYFEIGYALALGKPTILLAKKGTPLPFDIAGFRVLFYEDTIGGKAKLEDGLRRHLSALVGETGTIKSA